MLASRRGSYLGQIQGANTGPRIERVKAQIQAQESGLALQLARGICDAKVTKQQILLRHFVRPDTADIVRDAVTSMKAYRDQLDDCSTIQEVMGIEGASAAAYWPCYGALLPSEMQFTERSRRPPRDVVNAALSFLYVVLTGECVAALYGAGLDPAFGLLHADDGRRPSLALDLLEEFRPLVVDQVVMHLARRRTLTVDHGWTDPRGGVLLTAKGKDLVIDAYERRMCEEFRGAIPDFSGTLRRHLHRQAQILAGTISGRFAGWKGLSWR